jgi:protein ImuB
MKQPFILVKEQHKAFYVSNLGDVEYSLGIRINMSLSDAKTIEPSIIYYIQNNNYFIKEFSHLAHETMQFSPQVAVDDNFGLLLNITGCSHLFGGEEKMLTSIDTFFSQKGFHIKKAIASNPLLAKALAYFAPNTIVTNNNKYHIKTLPIDALFIEQTIINQLHNFGIKNIEMLLSLPRPALLKRFGMKLLERIDQLTGERELLNYYLEEKPHFIVSEYCSSPIKTHDHFTQIAAQLIDKAIKKLRERNYVICSMTILYKDTLKNIKTIDISSSLRNFNTKDWLDLLLLKAQKINFYEGIDDIQIIVQNFEQINYFQCHLDNKISEANKFDSLNDKIKNKLGDKAIFHLRLAKHHMPEQAVKKDFTIKMKGEDAHYSLPPRPIKLFAQPIPVLVIALLPDNPPVKIMWKHHTINVLHASGPERIEPLWWNSHSETSRDYFYIEDERGKRLWIYATGQPRQWFVHGIFA